MHVATVHDEVAFVGGQRLADCGPAHAGAPGIAMSQRPETHVAITPEPPHAAGELIITPPMALAQPAGSVDDNVDEAYT